MADDEQEFEEVWSGKRLGVIGAGNMAEALIGGVVETGLLPADMIHVHDPLPARREVFRAIGCQVHDGPAKAAACEAVLLAVKPQMLRAALEGVADHFRPDTLVISILAGVRLATLAALLPPKVKLVRVMPNTPLLVGDGMSALAMGEGVGEGEAHMALELFASAGTALEVEEEDLDAVTALSGSGPAYIFRFAEALIDAGVAMGLDREVANLLTVTTIEGAAAMLAEGGDPAELRERVTSPGGTTAAALRVFEERGFARMVGEALEAAKRRSGELGKDA